MPHARDEHGFSAFDEDTFLLLLENLHNSLALSTKNFTKTDTSPHPNYLGFLREQVIIQNIITEELCAINWRNILVQKEYFPHFFCLNASLLVTLLS